MTERSWKPGSADNVLNSDKPVYGAHNIAERLKEIDAYVMMNNFQARLIILTIVYETVAQALACMDRAYNQHLLSPQTSNPFFPK